MLLMHSYLLAHYRILIKGIIHIIKHININFKIKYIYLDIYLLYGLIFFIYLLFTIGFMEYFKCMLNVCN